MSDATIGRGFSTGERGTLGRLYWDAFGAKLGGAFRNERAGLRVVTESLRPDRSVVARVAGEPVGICGFNAAGHGALDVQWRTLRAHQSLGAAVRAFLVLVLLGRSEQRGVLVLDGICVSQRFRSRGIGSKLLDAVTDVARERGVGSVQLSVIDTNERAAALYLRHGFRVVTRGSLGVLRRVYGFDGYATMRKQLGR